MKTPTKLLVTISLIGLMITACGTAGTSGESTLTPAESTDGESTPAETESTPAEPAQTITLNFASDQPATSMQAGVSVQRWADEVTSATDGRIQVNTHYGESLTTQAEILDSLRAGVADIAAVSLNRFPAEFPLWVQLGTTHDLDLTLGVGPAEQTQVTRALMEEFSEMEAEVAEQGLIVNALLASGPHVIMAKQPIANLADLQGLKIRTYGTGIPRTFAEGGAVPVSVPISEVYTSTSSGAVDGAFSVADVFASLRYEEVAPYITVIGERGSTPVMNIGLAFLIREETWEQISPEDQAILTEVGLEVEQWLAEETLNRHFAAIDEMIERGAEVIEFDASATEEWRSQLSDYFGEAATVLNDLGHPGDEFVAAIRRNVEQTAD